MAFLIPKLLADVMFKSIFLKFFNKNKQKDIAPNLALKPQIDIELVTVRNREDEPPTTAEEILFKKAFLLRIKDALHRYDFVKKDKIEFLAKRILDDSYNQGEVLSLQEKKELNLNTRAKYSKELIDCFQDVEHFKFDPKFFCKNLQYTERTIVWALREIERLRNTGFIEKIHLSGMGEWNEKIVKLNNIPSLPIIDYTQEQCLFFVTGHIDY